MKTLYIIILLFLSSIGYSQSDSTDVKPTIEAFGKKDDNTLEVETTTVRQISYEELLAKDADYRQAVKNLMAEWKKIKDLLKKCQEFGIEAKKEEPENEGE